MYQKVIIYRKSVAGEVVVMHRAFGEGIQDVDVKLSSKIVDAPAVWLSLVPKPTCRSADALCTTVWIGGNAMVLAVCRVASSEQPPLKQYIIKVLCQRYD